VLTGLSRREFLARATAAGVATPLLVKAAAAWGDSIDFRPNNLVADEVFVWPNKLVVRGPGARVLRCAFVGPWDTGVSFLGPGKERDTGVSFLGPGKEWDTAGSGLVILDANHCEVSHCYFAACERVTSDDLAKAEAWIKGGWLEQSKLGSFQPYRLTPPPVVATQP
jgi:hypothetical protein